uniref:Uncharacterized protein n=1 Tax=Vespula pensylvanica TaxID=30213 RepID=A0A834UFB6_VESPE|nr:hypothetical protein H0235_003466 [Vespula pensylvanica]
MEIHFTKTATAMATAKMRSKVRTVFAVASLTSTTLEPLPRKKVRKAKIERRLHELVLKKLNSVLEGRRVDTLRFRFNRRKSKQRRGGASVCLKIQTGPRGTYAEANFVLYSLMLFL